MNNDLVFGVSDFVAVLNQTLEFAYPRVSIIGELTNFKISKNQWLHFDLKDDTSSVRFFGTKFNLPGPLREGMMLRVTGAPRLHPLYGFNIHVQSIAVSGEGSIKRARTLLEAKLTKEGLFALERKRPLPYPPERIGLITSAEAAAYGDFCKVLGDRWAGVEVEFADVQVQGEAAIAQIVGAIEHFNALGSTPEVLVLVRGGGSKDDLAVYDHEQVVRAVAGSRIPILVAVGHEADLSLSEMAADLRASTPSNAAELLVPERRTVISELQSLKKQLVSFLKESITTSKNDLTTQKFALNALINQSIEAEKAGLKSMLALLNALNPKAILKRGYAIVRQGGRVIVKAAELSARAPAELTFQDGVAIAKVSKVNVK